ncbi:MAG: peptidoglycan-binding domain-containing protein [Kiloniellales bacterium]|nr:peptidoglycan-binding domain-containing protein [Kiloniellales bacterium]
MLRVASLYVALAVILAACGSSEGDRAASGAGIGAAGGAVVGAVTGLSIVEGALIGAAVGGATGYLTDEDTINLGDPIWEDDDSAGGQSGTVTRVQGGLAQLGYNPGPVDGVMGPQTAEAIREYQRDHGLLIDGRATPQLADHIEQRI